MKKIVEFSDRKKINDEAASWILRLESDQGLGATEKEELRDWMNQSVAHRECFQRLAKSWVGADAVSYTHLTLPTTPYV